MTTIDAEDVKALANTLIDIGMKVSPEGEPLDLTGDWDLDMEGLSLLRSRLSSMRTAIDLVNRGLAAYWFEKYPGQRIDLNGTEWYVDRSKVKRLVNDDLFMGWVASLNAEGLKKVFTPSQLAKVAKTTGMTPAEADTHIEKVYTGAGISIQHKETK